MINITDRPIVIGEGKELEGKIRGVLKKFLDILNEKYEIKNQLKKPRSHNFRKSPEKAFFIYFSPYELTNIQYGDAFVQALVDVVKLGSRNQGMTDAFKNLNGFLNNEKGLSATSSIKVKGLIKLLLFTLWCEKVIVLPYNFHFGGNAFIAYHDFILAFETEVAAFFRGYKSQISNQKLSDASLPQSGAETLYKYGPRVIWATDFHRFEDVNIVEICNLYQFIIKYKDENFQGSGSPPSALMLRELLRHHSDKLKYTSTDVESFVLWSHKPSARKYDFQDFMSNKDSILAKIQANKIDKARSYTKNYDSKKRSIVDGSQQRSINELLLLAAREDHESVVEYFSKMHGVNRKGLEWLRRGSPYSGREHVYLGSISSLWLEAWNEWMKFRKTIQGYDSEDGPNRAFNLLCDYLFLYLPWWKELFPDNGVILPLSPNQLKRSIFIHRTQLNGSESLSIDRLPLTFLDLLPFRTPNPDARYNIINQLIQFLDWVEISFEDDERIAGSAYRNPLKRIDLPRVKKKSKTTKIPFTKRVYPHLLFYCYAIEAFGEYLQRVAMERSELFASKYLRQQKFFSTGPLPEDVSSVGSVSRAYLEDWPDNFGYIPFISYRGKNYPIYRLPDVYQWALRKINLDRYKISPGVVVTRWLPHLTALRMLIGAVETGLRLQSIQWLDLREWDVINIRKGVLPTYDFNMVNFQNGNFVLPIHITTDKTKVEAWDVLTVFRIRSCFYREQYFRESINEDDMDFAVDYDGIKNSRFGKILPLFRSNNSSKPISDNIYSKYWVHLLWGFEEYFDTNVSEDNEFVQFVYLRKTDYEEVPDYFETDIKDLLAVNTPHACRATYATNRTGILEASDVARQLGHSNTVVTMHYTVSTPENMAEKLESVEREIQTGFNRDNSNTSYIRTDKPESALYKNFQENRSQTIDTFQFAPSIALWSTEDLTSKLDGIDMLKNSPMSQITFRETHICPVGEACPADILVKIGEPLRCGLCPLAMKCVDHLPAIAAKINQLKMRVRSNVRRAEQLSNQNEPTSTVDPYYELAEMDANELTGWQLSHDILLEILGSVPKGSDGEYLVQFPDIVKKHLQVVTVDRKISEFFLQRISDSNAYPSMSDPEIRRIADRYSRYILTGNYSIGLDEDPVAALAGYIKTKMEPLGLTISDLAEKIDQFELARESGQSILLNNQSLLLKDVNGVD